MSEKKVINSFRITSFYYFYNLSSLTTICIINANIINQNNIFESQYKV